MATEHEVRGGAALDQFVAQLAAPPVEFGAMPFWLWNDDLDEQELLRQVHRLEEAGCGGVVIHPRVGLSPRVGYLTDEYFRLVRRVVDECAALGLKVILYDEASYPSGSACGRVVAANPEFAARALTIVQKDVSGPWLGYWRPSAGRSLVNRLVCVVLARLRDGVVDPATLRLLEPEEHDLVRLDLPAGDWRVMACLDVPSGGHIRGAYPWHESGTATAPPAADLLNPAAVETFIALTHDAYARALADHLGSTVVAMFTDEPSPLGKGARRGLQPYSPGLVAWLAERLGRSEASVLAWLPALWQDLGPQTEAFRAAYVRGVDERIKDVFYRAQAAWCERHGLALTGHPAASNDMASLAGFHWPGQDMVWRYVVPGNDSGLAGAHSVAAKAATSAARAKGRRRIATEVFGAYGWHLSLDEVKWLLDWHLARGNNLFVPGSAYYSVRGGRAFESEPDLFLHNCWWQHIRVLMDYVRRMSWLLADCQHVCDVAVLGNGYALPWAAARALCESQIDFLYLDDDAVAGATVEDGRLRAGTQAYRVVVVDGAPDLSERSRSRLREFAAAGGCVVDFADGADLVTQVRRQAAADVQVDPPAPDLRVLHVRKNGVDVYALFNEGEHEIDGRLWVAAAGEAAWYDACRDRHSAVVRPDVGDTAPAARVPGPATSALGPVARGNPDPTDREGPAGGQRVRFALGRRESRLLLVGGPPAAPIAPAAAAPGADESRRTVIAVDGPWRVSDAEGRPVEAPALGDWTRVRALERFSGTLVYTADVQLPDSGTPFGSVEIDMGAVGEAAEVHVNGAAQGFAMWAPYRLVTAAAAWRPGPNVLEVRVTNSAANAYEGAMRPSGLLGPVRLYVQRPIRLE